MEAGHSWGAETWAGWKREEEIWGTLTWGLPSPTPSGKAAREPHLPPALKRADHPTREKLTPSTARNKAQRAPFKCVGSYAHTHAGPHTCMHKPVYVSMHVHEHSCRPLWTCMPVFPHKCICIHTCISIHEQIMRTYSHVCVYIGTCVGLRALTHASNRHTGIYA